MVHIYTPNGGLAGRKELHLLLYIYNRYHMAEPEKKFGNLLTASQVRSVLRICQQNISKRLLGIDVKLTLE